MTQPLRLDGAALLRRVETAVLPARTLTFKELVAAYVAGKPPCAPRDYRLARWITAFGARVAWEITGEELGAALDALLEAGYAPATVNREHGEIAAILNWGIKHRRRTGAPLDFRNPLTGRPKLPEPVRRVQLADEKIERLLALAKVAAYPRMYGLVLAALTSGARRNELRRMTWGNTDLVRGIAQIGVDHKTGQWRTLLLVPALVAELRTYPQSASEHLVFPRSGNPFEPHDERREWRRLRVQIGEPSLHWHDLRHVCTARLLRSGASLHVTSRVLGHVDARMVSRRYGSLETGDLLRAVVVAGEGLG
jgi:integrase